MGFLDKAKATATQAMAQGQAKVGAIQQSRTEAELYRTLGEASYQAQRRGGDPAAVEAALTALDTHFAQVAEAAAAAQAAQAAAPAPAAPATGTATPAGGGSEAASGNFTLDDM